MPGIHSSAALALDHVPLSESTPIPEPPARLSTTEKRIWRILVRSMPDRHFSASDRALLERYCAASLQLREAMEHIQVEGERVGDLPNPWLKVHERQLGLLRTVIIQLQRRSSSDPGAAKTVRLSRRLA